ncbi:MAG: hypothetical protein M3N57_11815 [Actinomycetota bacterium]|nr:hypothetical protein [Actinomycetota bacterium]
MAPDCPRCGATTDYVRARFEIPVPTGRVLADEVPALRCNECGFTVPAEHVRPQLEAVIELAQDVEGATVRKDFTAVPLRQDESSA